MADSILTIPTGAIRCVSLDLFGFKGNDFALAQSTCEIVRPTLEVDGQKFQLGHMPITAPAPVMETDAGSFALREPITWHLYAKNSYFVIEDPVARAIDRSEEPWNLMPGRVIMR